MKNKEGFTLIEILLVIAAISILASIVIVAINPAKQLAQARNAQRTSNVNTILNATWQYAIDNNGILPTGILESATCSAAANEICIAQSAADTDCTDATPDLINLFVLVENEEYISRIPTDPTGSGTHNTGYHIAKSANGRVTVCAPDAELGETVSVTR